jgi:hypothetical protein
MKPFSVRVLSALFCLMLMSAKAESAAIWFHKRVVWQAGKEPRVWETKIVSPDGKEHFRLALVPLWAVEGGIVGIEILVARPEHPDDNLLGHRDSDVPQPFVVTVEELERGINKSPCGAMRNFKLDRTTLQAEIRGARLGEGVGECRNCKNIQDLTIDFELGSQSEIYLPQPTDQETLTPPTGWRKVDAGPFSILAPLGWEFHQLAGVDSYVGEFVGDGLTLTFDFGGYSNPLKKEKKPAYVVVHKSIGGFRAKVVSPRTPGHGITGAYFRNVGLSNALCLFGQDLTSTQQELALKIFETIRFGGLLPRYVLPPPSPSATQNQFHMPD